MKGCGQPWSTGSLPSKEPLWGQGWASADGSRVLEQPPSMKAPQEVDGQ